MLALGCWLSAVPAFAAAPPEPMPEPRTLAAQAKDVRIERRVWDEKAATVRTAASAVAEAEWLGRLIDVGLRESGRWPDSLCAVACQRCPEQLHVDVTFKVGSKGYFLSLYLREGLAFLRTDSAAGWSFADSIATVLGIVREGLPKDAITQGWIAPSLPPGRLDPDSAAFRDDDVLVTGMPEVLTRTAPPYPAAARNAGISGVVHVQALVAADGSVARVRVAKSVPLLDDAALEAVRKWKFKPATCGGRPVPVWAIMPVRFTLR